MTSMQHRSKRFAFIMLAGAAVLCVGLQQKITAQDASELPASSSLAHDLENHVITQAEASHTLRSYSMIRSPGLFD
jgi:hypothetical protein